MSECDAGPGENNPSHSGNRSSHGNNSSGRTDVARTRRVLPSLLAGLLLLTPIMVWGAVVSLDRLDPGTPVPAILSTVDVNHAPWWELAMLPRIGEGKAKAIVAFHESHTNRRDDGASPQVFQSPADLRRIKGIGPKTVARLAPHIRCGPSERKDEGQRMKDEG